VTPNPAQNKIQEVIFMTDYREILRLKSQRISQRSIAVSCGCARNTVANVFQQASHFASKIPLVRAGPKTPGVKHD